MTDQINDDSIDSIDNDSIDNGEENFADLLDAYSSGIRDEIHVGDKIKGRIIAIGKESLFVDTGSKIDGVVDIKELLDDQNELPYREGDDIELYVVGVDESEIRLSKAVSGIGGLNMLTDAYENTIPVEGKVMGPCKGGFNIEVMKRRAFCPISQMDVKYVENQEVYTGKDFQFLITQFEEKGRNIVLSRRKLLEIELEKQRNEFLKDLKIGRILEGTVTKIMPYGAFVEISPGVEGMAHISELGWSKRMKPEEVLKQGDMVKVKVIDFEATDENSARPKISLSIKQLTEDPWLTVGEKLKAGQKVNGTVTHCEKFGAFVEISPGIEGLIHISEMSYIKRIVNVEDMVRPKDSVIVVVKEIDEKKRRISLSLKDAEGDPWTDIEDKYNIGQSLAGILERREDFGFFIRIEPGITGLLPKSNINRSPDAKSIDKLKEGDAVTVKIDVMDVSARKITLSLGDSSDETDWKQYSKDSEKSVGSLGEKLKAALNSKKL